MNMKPISTELRIFGNPKVVPQGWFWALASRELRVGEKRELVLFGETLVLYRSAKGVVHAIGAFCPHMGAHLKEGKVEGESLRCAFHGWKFSKNGECLDIPCAGAQTGYGPSSIPARRTHPIGERYGMIWIHSVAGVSTSDPLPSFPALDGLGATARTDRTELRNCHPTLILGGGIDEEHFHFVHQKTTAMTGGMKFEWARLAASVIRFQNVARIPETHPKSRLMHRLYQGVLKYNVSYWYASTALAEFGPPFFPLYSIFAYRPTSDGKTEGLNIYVTRKRTGLWGGLVSAICLYAAQAIMKRGGGEDRPIQNSIRLNISPYALANPPFRAFVEYVEEQPYIRLGSQARAPAAAAKISRTLEGSPA